MTKLTFDVTWLFLTFKDCYLTALLKEAWTEKKAEKEKQVNRFISYNGKELVPVRPDLTCWTFSIEYHSCAKSHQKQRSEMFERFKTLMFLSVWLEQVFQRCVHVSTPFLLIHKKRPRPCDSKWVRSLTVNSIHSVSLGAKTQNRKFKQEGWRGRQKRK